ncbi:putative chromatin spt2 [Erysiphe neolycopersici]|uniref:Putative chromatin spt2 n=1 Tax=Erysiphe neolycopersici TaxID=212602 RepID=A0A420HR12_9PEZI|nr:putative chromatin spt2 [Erysiphe neolycopersici]
MPLIFKYIGDLLAQITGQPNFDSEKPVYDDKNLLNRKSNGQTQRPLTTAQGNSRPEGTTRITVPTSKSATPKSSETSLSRDVSMGTNKKPLGSSNSKAVPNLQNRETKQPKKGSYAEIMARGKAAHAILGQVGRITHKNIERPLSKREREEKKTYMALKKPKTSASNDNPLRLNHKKERHSGRVTPEPPKRIKKAALATTGYTGTARPKTSGLPRSSRFSGSDSTRKDLNEMRRSSKPTNRYLSDDEEEEEYSEEDQHYESDLSDMEADAFEVDEEEEIAAKIARREDAEALAEENRLKREKEAKRKKLAAMAKSRSGRR